MSDLFWLSDTQIAHLKPCVSRFHGTWRVAARYDRCPKVVLWAITLAAMVIYWL